MGSEMIVHFDPAGGVVDSTGAAQFAGDEDDLASRDHLSGAGKLVGRLDPRTRAAAGRELTMSLDLARIHLFDPETDRAIACRARASRRVGTTQRARELGRLLPP